ncbi:hypothetical protein QBC44DRAFT_364855 [Cladorrhinum sp. PSN332]|nr:hypothetical protein QBC44DRAFT_364855 [Cladorrhinum sp. PSN332]
MLYTHSIKVVVGVEEDEWSIHEKLLDVSAFFNKAITGPWKESQDGVLRLPEDDLEAVKLFIKWLYTRACNPDADPLGKILSEPDMFLYVKAYVFATKYIIPELADYLFEAVHRYFTRDPGNGGTHSHRRLRVGRLRNRQEAKTMEHIPRPLAVNPVPEHYQYLFENDRIATSKMKLLLMDHFLTHSRFKLMDDDTKEKFREMQRDVPDFGSCLLDRMFLWASAKSHDCKNDGVFTVVGCMEWYSPIKVIAPPARRLPSHLR